MRPWLSVSPCRWLSLEDTCFLMQMQTAFNSSNSVLATFNDVTVSVTSSANSIRDFHSHACGSFLVGLIPMDWLSFCIFLTKPLLFNIWQTRVGRTWFSNLWWMLPFTEPSEIIFCLFPKQYARAWLDFDRSTVWPFKEIPNIVRISPRLLPNVFPETHGCQKLPGCGTYQTKWSGLSASSTQNWAKKNTTTTTKLHAEQLFSVVGLLCFYAVYAKPWSFSLLKPLLVYAVTLNL